MMVGYLAVGLGNGVVAVPWQDIIAKSIPSFLRGRFFGAIHFATASAAIGIGFAVRWMLGPSGPGFPRSYTVLFTLVGVFLAISTIGCWMVREPIRPVLERPQSLREIVRGVVPLLRGRPAFRMLVVTALLAFSMSYLMPFYMVHAKRDLGVQEAMAGVYILVMMVGTATFGLVWGQINDRRGPRSVVRGACGAVLLAPVLALGLPALGSGVPWARQALPGMFSLVFLCGGAAHAGMWTGVTNYLFELATHQERPRYIALMSFLGSPGALAPLLVGWLLNFVAFQVMFAALALCGVAAVLTSWRMPPEPRAQLDRGQAGQ
jgi:MFS family permease